MARTPTTNPTTAARRNSAGVPRALLLFDIDGTLVDTGGAGYAALCEAFAEIYAADLGGRPIPPLDLAGATDSGLLRDLFASLAFGASAQARVGDFYARYLACLEARLFADAIAPGRRLAGAAELLDLLGECGGFELALLTGNIRAAAFAKLRAYGIDHHFGEGGAFGDDHHCRDELARIARRRAGSAAGASIVIGDTPKDIRCARAIGAKAVAVATGRFSAAELSAHQPDMVLEDLSDAEAVLGALGR